MSVILAHSAELEELLSAVHSKAGVDLHPPEGGDHLLMSRVGEGLRLMNAGAAVRLPMSQGPVDPHLTVRQREDHLLIAHVEVFHQEGE